MCKQFFVKINEMQGEGVGGESKAKMAVVGKVFMNVAVAELLAKEEMMKKESNSHHHLRRKLPIKLRVNGLFIEATLSVRSKFIFLVINFFMYYYYYNNHIILNCSLVVNPI